MQLKAGSLVYKEWIKPSVPIYMKYFVFNVTNPNEVMEGLEIPNVTQIGPYSYRYGGRDETGTEKGVGVNPSHGLYIISCESVNRALLAWDRALLWGQIGKRSASKAIFSPPQPDYLRLRHCMLD